MFVSSVAAYQPMQVSKTRNNLEHVCIVVWLHFKMCLILVPPVECLSFAM